MDTVIGVLRQEPDQLDARRLRFEDDHDGLDALRHARLETSRGKVFALVRHRGSPTAGTEIVTRDDSPSLLEDLEDVLAELHVTRGDLVWEHPNIRAARHAEVLLPGVAMAVRALSLTTAASVMGAGLVMWVDTDSHPLLHFAGVALVVAANVVALAFLLPAHRRLRGFLAKRTRAGSPTA